MEVKNNTNFCKNFKINIISIITIVFGFFYTFICLYGYFFNNKKLLLVYDEMGNHCGYGGLIDYDKVYFYEIQPNDIYTKRACVSECPIKYNGFIKSYPVDGNEGEIDEQFFYNSTQCKISIY